MGLYVDFQNILNCLPVLLYSIGGLWCHEAILTIFWFLENSQKFLFSSIVLSEMSLYLFWAME